MQLLPTIFKKDRVVLVSLSLLIIITSSLFLKTSAIMLGLPILKVIFSVLTSGVVTTAKHCYAFKDLKNSEKTGVS